MTKKKLLQAYVPTKVATWVKTQAEREGISVAAWLRRVVLELYRKEMERN